MSQMNSGGGSQSAGDEIKIKCTYSRMILQ